MANTSENKDNTYSAKPPIFDGEKFDYWKDRIESFFLGHDVDLWDIVVEGYEHPKDAEGKAISRSQMTDAQKKTFKDHHKARTEGVKNTRKGGLNWVFKTKTFSLF